MDVEYLPEKHQEVIRAAQEILNDFDTYGEVLQSDKNGEYGADTAIGRLREALQD